MYTYIQLNDTPRVSRFPYPTEGVVIMHNFSAREHIYKYVRTEVCFRLESACEQAVDIVNGVRRTTLFPHVVYKYPGHVYQYRAEPRNAIAFFYSPEVSGELKKLDLLPEDEIQKFYLTDRIRNLLDELTRLSAVSQVAPAADRIDYCCFGLLQELLFQRVAGKGPENPRSQGIMKAVSYIQMNIGKSLTLDQIAEASGVSRRTFYRQWKETFQVSPAQYILNQIMERSEYLLLHTAMSVKEIAHSMGFPNEKYFMTAFRKYYGLPPNQYRKNAARENEDKETVRRRSEIQG